MRALVVGGGIAGPATAMALQHVGVEATVLERRDRPDPEQGSYFTIAPNGLHALDLVGAREAVLRAGGFPTRRNVMVGASGRTLGTISLGRPLPDGTVAMTVKRSRLGAALVQEARRRGIEVRTGARVVHATTNPRGAAVRLEDGTELEADLVVGADGVHSVVRAAIDPGAPGRRFVGLTNFGGITRSTPLAAGLPEEAWHFVFGRRAFLGAHRTPVGDVVWFVNLPRHPIPPAERASTSDDEWRRILAGALEDDAGPGAELVRTGELELAADNTFDLPHVPTWHRGRLVVLGDAAHAPSPSSGQGAAMALEDAVVLAGSVSGASSVEAGLADFVRRRRERVERIVAVGARSSSAKTPGPVGRLFRDAALRLVFRFLVTERSQDRITGYRVSWDAEPAADAA